jgi:GT2 family glycosyltransferase
MVSILIPTRDRCEMLRQCLDSIYRATDYRKYEIIILDNDSKEPATLEYFQELAGKVQVVPCPGPFNFSAMNNLGATKANGDYLLFLNNDTQVIRGEWLRAMLEQAQRPEVGAVGAKLLFPDERIQHAGVVLGMWGLVGHAFKYEAGNHLLYFGFSDAIRDCSAVTAACMMMRRSIFDEVGCFDEKLAVEFNDIDLCLRLRERGYLVVYTPLALLHHYESVSRRHFSHPNDHHLFVKRWEHCLRNGDPYYNRNLTLAGWDFSIAV